MHQIEFHGQDFMKNFTDTFVFSRALIFFSSLFTGAVFLILLPLTLLAKKKSDEGYNFIFDRSFLYGLVFFRSILCGDFNIFQF